MYSSLLLVFLVASASAIYCPDGYKDVGDGTCYAIRLVKSIDRQTAYEKCKEEGAVLAPIFNMFTNVAITSALPAFDKVWIGQTCLGINTCYTDSGESTSFENFYLTTNYSAGPFVYVDNMGMWGLGDGDDLADGYVCRLETSQIRCPSGYEGIGERCYKVVVDRKDPIEAEATCQQYGSHLTSIKSVHENGYVRWLASQYTNDSFINLGFQASDAVSVNWTDSSVQTYSNLVYYDGRGGACGAMSLTSPVFPTGTWQTVSCADKLAFVCGTHRGPINVTNDFTGELPAVCLTTYQMKNATSGRITSPGYPLNVNTKNKCHVLITAPTGYKITAQSNDWNISDGFLGLCNQFTPFGDCTYTPDLKSYTSYNGMLYIHFESSGQSKWSVTYTTESIVKNA